MFLYETIRVSEMVKYMTREFAYYLKREHLYSNYRAHLKNSNESYEEYRFWVNVLNNFYAFILEKYNCKDIIRTPYGIIQGRET